VKLTSSAEVALAGEEVRERLGDPRAVIAAVPGLDVARGCLEIRLDGRPLRVSGSATVRGQGPTRLRLRGRVDEGDGGVVASMVLRVDEVAEERARIVADADLQLSGDLAVSGASTQATLDELVRAFAENLARDRAGAATRAEATPADVRLVGMPSSSTRRTMACTAGLVALGVGVLALLRGRRRATR
jgi:hypothetical protein